jgi:hypothetical protein
MPRSVRRASTRCPCASRSTSSAPLDRAPVERAEARQEWFYLAGASDRF